MPLPFGNFSKPNMGDKDDYTAEDGRAALIGDNADLAATLPPANPEAKALRDINRAEYGAIEAAAMSVVTAAFAGSLGDGLQRAKAEYLIGTVAGKIPADLLPALLLAIVRVSIELNGKSD